MNNCQIPINRKKLKEKFILKMTIIINCNTIIKVMIIILKIFVQMDAIQTQKKTLGKV